MIRSSFRPKFCTNSCCLCRLGWFMGRCWFKLMISSFAVSLIEAVNGSSAGSLFFGDAFLSEGDRCRCGYDGCYKVSRSGSALLRERLRCLGAAVAGAFGLPSLGCKAGGSPSISLKLMVFTLVLFRLPRLSLLLTECRDFALPRLWTLSRLSLCCGGT